MPVILLDLDGTLCQPKKAQLNDPSGRVSHQTQRTDLNNNLAIIPGVLEALKFNMADTMVQAIHPRPATGRRQGENLNRYEELMQKITQFTGQNGGQRESFSQFVSREFPKDQANKIIASYQSFTVLPQTYNAYSLFQDVSSKLYPRYPFISEAIAYSELKLKQEVAQQPELNSLTNGQITELSKMLTTGLSSQGFMYGPDGKLDENKATAAMKDNGLEDEWFMSPANANGLWNRLNQDQQAVVTFLAKNGYQPLIDKPAKMRWLARIFKSKVLLVDDRIDNTQFQDSDRDFMFGYHFNQSVQPQKVLLGIKKSLQKLQQTRPLDNRQLQDLEGLRRRGATSLTENLYDPVDPNELRKAEEEAATNRLPPRPPKPDQFKPKSKNILHKMRDSLPPIKPRAEMQGRALHAMLDLDDQAKEAFKKRQAPLPSTGAENKNRNKPPGANKRPSPGKVKGGKISSLGADSEHYTVEISLSAIACGKGRWFGKDGTITRKTVQKVLERIIKDVPATGDIRIHSFNLETTRDNKLDRENCELFEKHFNKCVEKDALFTGLSSRGVNPQEPKLSISHHKKNHNCLSIERTTQGLVSHDHRPPPTTVSPG